MAKQSGGMPKIDEDFMKELISQGVPSKEDNKPNDAPHTNLASQVTQEGTADGNGAGGENDKPASARAVRATTGKPTFRK